MIPDTRLSSVLVRRPWVETASRRTVPLVDYSSGPSEIGDITNGVSDQEWRFEYLNNWLRVTRTFDDAGVDLIYVEGVTGLSGTFDYQGQPAHTYRVGEDWFLRTFESNQWLIRQLPAGTQFARVTLDRDQNVNQQEADVCLTYIRNNRLLLCYQRENYAVEHDLGDGTGLYLVAFGHNTSYRLQWRCSILKEQ